MMREGCFVRENVGIFVGRREIGFVVKLSMLGRTVGIVEDGVLDGFMVGIKDGELVGLSEGIFVGSSEGLSVGDSLGLADGVLMLDLKLVSCMVYWLGPMWGCLLVSQ
jgi:hypothetical protein